MDALTLLERIHVEVKKNIGLTQQEEAVVKALCSAKSNKQIAKLLGISIRTIDGYIKVIYQKLQLNNEAINARCAVIIVLLEQDVITLHGERHHEFY